VAHEGPEFKPPYRKKKKKKDMTKSSFWFTAIGC
jgi:hypothetical protein